MLQSEMREARTKGGKGSKVGTSRTQVEGESEMRRAVLGVVNHQVGGKC